MKSTYIAICSLFIVLWGFPSLGKPVTAANVKSDGSLVGQVAKYIQDSGSKCDPKNIDKFLLAGLDPNSPSANGDRLLSSALFYGAHKCALALLQHGATVHFETAIGPFLNSALPMAAGAVECDPAVIEALLRLGADPDEMWAGATPLLSAAEAKNVACARVLLRAGANVNRGVGPRGITPLMAAQWAGIQVDVNDLQGRLAMTKLLLIHNAKLNAVTKPALGNIDAAGQTAVFYAAGLAKPNKPCSECVVLLLKSGADPDEYDNAGRTPLLWALMQKHSTDLAAISALVKGGADIDVANAKTGETPLMAAAARGDPEIVQYLLSVGAARCVTDKNGNNAAYYAQKNLHNELATALACL